MKSLKLSIAASSVLLALGALIAWKNNQQLATAQIKQDQLVTELKNSGSSIAKSHSKNGARPNKHLSEDNEKGAIHINNPSHLADLMLKIKNPIKNCDQSDPKTKTSIDELRPAFHDLGYEDWRIIFNQLRTNQNSEKTGDNHKGFNEIVAILYDRDYLLEDSLLLRLASEFSEVFQDNTSGMTSIENCLFTLLAKDSDAAIGWVQKNHLKFPGFVREHGFACGFLSPLSIKNPARSLELVSELEIKDLRYAISVCALDQKSNEQRTSFLNALRGNNFSLPENETREEMIDYYKSCLAQSALEQGFDTGTQWLSIEGNQPNDWESLIRCIGERTKATNFEKWAEWIEKTLPPKTVDDCIHALISNWTKKDYQQAGEWLLKTSEGPTKNAGIRAYAETIATYEPATAVQWAEKLPAGEHRNQTLKTIYHRWPKTDLVGKEAFNKSYQLGRTEE